MDMARLVKPEFVPESGDLWPAISTLHGTAEVLESANRTPDNEVKRDLVSAVVKNLQNVIDALTEPAPMPDDDE